MHDFFAEPGKKRITEAIARAERVTGAEIVVAVRRAADRYREAEALGGLTLAMLLLCLFLYWPEPFDYTYFPIEQALAFVVGALFVNGLPGLKRVLVRPSTRAERVLRAAKAAFYDLGIARTRGRNGVLVYVSTFERAVVLVPDVGVDEKALGSRYSEVAQKLDRAVRLDGDLERFAIAVEELGRVLGATHKRAHDDENELPDAVSEDATGEEAGRGDDEASDARDRA